MDTDPYFEITVMIEPAYKAELKNLLILRQMCGNSIGPLERFVYLLLKAIEEKQPEVTFALRSKNESSKNVKS